MHASDITGLVEAHGVAVYRFCCKLTGNKTDADDLYQETYLKAFEQCHKIDGENGNPKAFLLSITAKLWKSSRRKYARRQRIAPSVPLDEAEAVAGKHSIEETMLSNALQEAVRQAADSLTDKYRMPVYLYYTLEMDIEGIAAVLNIPPGTVKSRLHKARAMIKERMEANQSETPRLARTAL